MNIPPSATNCESCKWSKWTMTNHKPPRIAPDRAGECLYPMSRVALPICFRISGGTPTWIGYSLEQLQTLQRVSFKSPLDFPICIPSKRIAFIENEAKKAARREKLIAEGKDPDKASGPSHSNYVTYLGQNREAFARVFSALGQVKL